MLHPHLKPGRTLLLAAAGLLASLGAMAEKFETQGYFGSTQRTVVHNYYSQQYRPGQCPPGLLSKNEGCMAPGQTRQWTVGQPLPRGVIYHSVPPALVMQLGAPQAGYRYVRVAADILLIATSTGIVIDALEDFNRLQAAAP
jgi:Ni/Co efflux regulator RcnB